MKAMRAFTESYKNVSCVALNVRQIYGERLYNGVESEHNLILGGLYEYFRGKGTEKGIHYPLRFK